MAEENDLRARLDCCNHKMAIEPPPTVSPSRRMACGSLRPGNRDEAQ